MKETFEKINQMLQSEGLNAFDYLKYVHKGKNSLLNLSDESLQSIRGCYESIENREMSTSEKGKSLEELTYLLFHSGYTALFECRKNCKTSTSVAVGQH